MLQNPQVKQELNNAFSILMVLYVIWTWIHESDIGSCLSAASLLPKFYIFPR